MGELIELVGPLAITALLALASRKKKKKEEREEIPVPNYQENDVFDFEYADEERGINPPELSPEVITATEPSIVPPPLIKEENIYVCQFKPMMETDSIIENIPAMQVQHQSISSKKAKRAFNLKQAFISKTILERKY